MTDTITVGAFVVLVGALLVPIIPFSVLKLTDSFLGRMLLLLLPLVAFKFFGIELGILVGAVVGLVLNRTHDFLAIQSSGMMNYLQPQGLASNSIKQNGIPPQIYNGRITVVRDLSPNLINANKIPDSVILLDPPVKRMERKYNIV
jgi:hypothetical protein